MGNNFRQLGLDLVDFSGQMVKFLIVTGAGFVFWYLYSGLIEADYSNFERSVLNLLRIIGAFMTSIMALIVTTYFDFRRQREQFEKTLKDNSEFLRYAIEVFQHGAYINPLRILMTSLYFAISAERKVFAELAIRRLVSAAEDIRNITNGNFSVEPHDEIDVTKELLRKGGWSESVLAVNYREEEWWNSPSGATYLDIHKDIVSSNPKMNVVRIFIFDTNSKDYLNEILARHEAAGVEAYAVDEELVPQELREDFVLYDKRYVRTANISTDRSIGRQAVITNTDRVVGSYVEKFEQIMAIISDQNIAAFHA